MQSYHPDIEAAIQSNHFDYCYLLSLPGGVYVTDAYADINFEGNTYIANGLPLKLPSTSKTQSISLASYSLTLSNIDNTIAKAYRAANYQGEESIVYRVIYIDNIMQGSPTVHYKGILNAFKIKEGLKSSTLNVQLTSFWANYNKKGGRYTSNSVQNDVHSGDNFFKYAHVEDTEAKAWGKR